jgi:long-chain acyl-CoA synthetase
MNEHVYVELLHQSVLKHAHLPCLHIKRNGKYLSWSYSDFHKDLNRLSSALKKLDLKKGTNAIVIGENSPEWIIAYNAIILTGACTVPVDPGIPPSEIESILSITEAKVVFCSKIFLNLFRTLKQKHQHLEKIVLLESESDDKEPAFEEFLRSGNEEKDAFLPVFSPDDPMVIIFTSGTTGKAKGVVLTQKNFTAIGVHGIPRMRAGVHDTMCAVLPLHHVFGSAACIAAALTSGLDLVIVPYVKGPLILEALREKEVTILPAVPKMIALFYESIMHNVKKKGPVVSTVFAGMKAVSATAGDTLGDRFRRGLFSSVHKGFGGKLRLIISGGAALNKKYWNGFRHMGFNILEGYGLTETYGPITVCPDEEPRFGSVGPALPENEIKISDPDESGIGEICLRGSCVFKGYYKDDELTSQVFDDQGWFHTGDLGRLDKDNFLFISGRKKDMIVLDSGKNVYPDELEDYYGTSSLIEEIGVFGVNQKGAEIVAAAIVPSKEIRKTHTIAQATDLIYEELVRMGKNLPVYRRISDFVTLYTPLPRTTTRKLKKMELKKIYDSIRRKSANREIPEEQLSVVEMALMETAEYTGVIGSIILISPKTDPRIINPRSHLEIDLGLDSLKRIELLTQIERRFSIRIHEDVFDKMESVGDLVSLVREHIISHNPTVEKVMGLKERILSDDLQVVKFPVETSLTAPLVSRFCGTFFKIKKSGAENFRDDSKSMIFASNHSHAMDVFWILNSLPSSVKSNTYFISDKKSSDYPAIPYALHRNNIIKTEKSGDPIELLKIYLSVIRNNRHLIVFPEGVINRNGQIGQFKSGIGLLARETGASIVPVKIVGPAHISSDKKYKQGSKGVIFGKPLTWSGLIDSGVLNHNSTPDDMAKHIRSLILQM